MTPWQELSHNEKHALVIDMINKGLSAGKIAQRVPGATRNAVIGFCSRNNVVMANSQNGWNRGAGTGALRKKKEKPGRIATVARVNIHDDEKREKSRYEKRFHCLPGSAPVSIMELSPNKCRWPVDGGFCGHKRSRGAYCTCHAKLAYTGVPDDKAI